MNSILSACTSRYDSLEAEIVQMIRAHRRDHKKLILVEGDSDKIVFQNFYERNQFDVYSSERFAGCIHFVTLVQHINEYYEKDFIVIKDADFDHLNFKTYDHYENLFLTDTHDLETLMLVNGLYQRMNLDLKINDGEKIMSDAIHEILNLSYLKWMNNKYDCRLNFNDSCHVGNCYSGLNEVSIDECLTKIGKCPKNIGKREFKNEEVEKFKEDHPLAESEMLQITNGHDMINAFVIKFKKEHRKNLSKKCVEKLLRDNFSMEDYKATQLYNNISGWLNRLSS